RDVPQGPLLEFDSGGEVGIHIHVASKYLKVLRRELKCENASLRPCCMSEIECCITPAASSVDNIVRVFHFDGWGCLTILVLLQYEGADHAALGVVKLNRITNFFEREMIEYCLGHAHLYSLRAFYEPSHLLPLRPIRSIVE